MNVLKKWWFWAAVVIVLAILLFVPMKSCGIISGPGEVGKTYISYFKYFTQGCPA